MPRDWQFDYTCVLRQRHQIRLREQGRTCDRVGCDAAAVTVRAFQDCAMMSRMYLYHCAKHSAVHSQVQHV